MLGLLQFCCGIVLSAVYWAQGGLATPGQPAGGLEITVALKEGLLPHAVDGHVQLLFAPPGASPLYDTDVDSTRNKFFGQNVFDFRSGAKVALSDGADPGRAVSGWPHPRLSELPPGAYTIWGFLNRYETVTRSDGSRVRVRVPCGDDDAPIDGRGVLTTPPLNVTVTGGRQTVDLLFTEITELIPFTGSEIGGCAQGNYPDTPNLKYVKILSRTLSAWWGRDTYIGATVLLPHGYEQSSDRYPVIYHQNHRAQGLGPYGYPDANFSAAWDAGTIPGAEGTAGRPTPKMIVVAFRHETPFYQHSYSVNTANIGPYGDAINDELIPVIEQRFRTIAQPYARIQDGGSTGGWASMASVIFRPDLFGACFSSYPDPVDFHRHQAIPLYTAANAYRSPGGVAIGSIREFVNGTEQIVATVEQENHWELTHGTSSRSSRQWDAWNAVFGVQGYNHHPLEPWNKVTGEIYPDAVELWKPMDLADYILANWDTARRLGDALRGRLHLSVGTWDQYYLDEAVQQFQTRIDARAGPGWAAVTVAPGKTHRGNYNDLDLWTYLDLVRDWIRDHAPDGKTPLSRAATLASGRGNRWDEVMARGGRRAAVARQAAPEARRDGAAGVVATPGRWDPGVELEAQWLVDGRPVGTPVAATQGHALTYPGGGSPASHVQLQVTGRKTGYEDETRRSNAVDGRRP